jgi:uncharacterized protein
LTPKVIDGGTRPLPTLTAENRPFWTNGHDDQLHLQRCSSCGYYLHPPGPICRRCSSRALHWEDVVGTGRVAAWTENHYPWTAAIPLPYLIAIVELDVQAGLSLLSQVVDCDVSQIHIGLPVRVAFDDIGEVSIPLFRPIA